VNLRQRRRSRVGQPVSQFRKAHGSAPAQTALVLQRLQLLEVSMKREHFHFAAQRRPALVVCALLVSALCGLLSASLGWGDDYRASSPGLDPAMSEPALIRDHAAAAPDHALLSASDVERALPVPTRTAGMTPTVSS
jgi:hypothetical protein